MGANSVFGDVFDFEDATAINVIVSQAALQSLPPAGSTQLEITRYSTFRRQITGLGDVSTRDETIWQGKAAFGDADEDSIFRVTESEGLVWLNGEAAPDATKGSIVWDDAATGSVTLYLHESITGLIAKTDDWPLRYGVKVLRSVGDDAELITRDPCSRGNEIVVLDGVTEEVG